MLALFLAVIGYQWWSSGESYLRLIGFFAMGGALGLSLIALMLWVQKQSSVDSEFRGFVNFFRQVFLLAIALYSLGVPLYAVAVTGKMPALLPYDRQMNKKVITRAGEPKVFWKTAGLHALPGVYCLFLALRRRN